MATKKPNPNTIIHLEATPEGVMTSQVANLNFTKMLQMMIPFIVDRSKAVYEAATKNTDLTAAQLDELKNSMYDTLNITFSNALTMFAPEIEARPDITEDAFIRARNELLEEEMRKAGYIPTPPGEVKTKESISEIKKPEKMEEKTPIKDFIPGQISIKEYLEQFKKPEEN